MKKLSCILMALVMLFTLLSGCAGNQSQNTTAAPAATSAATTKAAATTAATTAAPVSEVSTVTIMAPERDAASSAFIMADREKVPVWQEFQKVLDAHDLVLDFELIDPVQYEVVMQTRLAGAVNVPDIIKVGALSDEMRIAYARGGVFQSITNIVENYCKQETRDYIDQYYPFLLTAQALPEDGQAYWFAQTSVVLYGGEVKTAYQTLCIRNDWLEALELPMPTTTAELFDTAVAFQERDANGNGVIGDEKFSVAGDIAHSLLRDFGCYFGLVNGLSNAIINGSNQVTSCWYQDGMKPFIAYCKQLYDAGLLDLTTDGSQLSAQNALIAQYGYSTLTASMDSACGDANAAFVAMPQLSSEEGLHPVAFSTCPYNFSVSSAFAVTNACEDLAGPAKLLDVLYSEDYYLLAEFGIEGSCWEYDETVNADSFYTRGWRKSLIPSGVDNQKAHGDTKGMNLWNLALPRITTEDRSVEYYQKQIDAFYADGKDSVAKSHEEMIKSWDYTKYYDTGNVYAMATDEQNDALDLILVDLQTYHDELIVSLVTGEKSLDEWDTYIEELQMLGLDDLLEINQERFNRGMYFEG